MPFQQISSFETKTLQAECPSAGINTCRFPNSRSIEARAVLRMAEQSHSTTRDVLGNLPALPRTALLKCWRGPKPSLPSPISFALAAVLGLSGWTAPQVPFRVCRAMSFFTAFRVCFLQAGPGLWILGYQRQLPAPLSISLPVCLFFIGKYLK